MNFQSLFRKKTVQSILHQVELNESGKGYEKMTRNLGVRDLAAFGIAAIVGAGIFSTIGKASYEDRKSVV